jgi:Cu2+-exporting ATPase
VLFIFNPLQKQKKMIHTYRISGMTCEHCVQKVKKALGAVEGIQSVEVSLDPPEAQVSMHHHISVDQMNASLAKIGDYRLELHPVDHQHHESTPENVSGASNKPPDHSRHIANDSHHAGHGHNAAHGEMGHDHHRMMIADFRKRFWVSLLLSVPILALSPMIQHWLGVEWQFTGDK